MPVAISTICRFWYFLAILAKFEFCATQGKHSLVTKFSRTGEFEFMIFSSLSVFSSSIFSVLLMVKVKFCFVVTAL